MSRVSLSPGDLVYYAAHQALAVLIGKTEGQWEYALRSPRADDQSGPHLVNTYYAPESKLLDAISSGEFEYYENPES